MVSTRQATGLHWMMMTAIGHLRCVTILFMPRGPLLTLKSRLRCSAACQKGLVR